MLARRASAKINLALSVGPPAPSGMHPIASWMHAIDLADTIQLHEARRFEIEIVWADDAPKPTPIDWPAERDLAARAHAALQNHVGRALPARLVLTKRIPVGAGLGGGSSDAAAAILALNEAFDLGLDVETLRRLCAPLGSDITFFIDDADPPRPALVAGFADRIERLEARHDELILIIPACACPTGEVYGAYDALGPRELDEGRVRALARSFDLSALFNDLAPAAEQVRPEIARVRRQAIELLGQPVHVTGSGSAMFSFCPAGHARALDGLDATVVPTRLIGPG